MGPIADRSREFLGTSDAVIVRARRLFFKASTSMRGQAALRPRSGDRLQPIRALAIRFPRGTDWRQLDLKNPPDYKFRLSDAS